MKRWTPSSSSFTLPIPGNPSTVCFKRILLYCTFGFVCPFFDFHNLCFYSLFAYPHLSSENILLPGGTGKKISASQVFSSVVWVSRIFWLDWQFVARWVLHVPQFPQYRRLQYIVITTIIIRLDNFRTCVFQQASDSRSHLPFDSQVFSDTAFLT